MKNALQQLRKSLWELVVGAEHQLAQPVRDSYERFALPYSFKPQLTVIEAFIAACGALVRILIGSVVFAVWGTYTLLAWKTIPNVFLRGITVLVLVGTFPPAMGLIMLAISYTARWILPHRAKQS